MNFYFFEVEFSINMRLPVFKASSKSQVCVATCTMVSMILMSQIFCYYYFYYYYCYYYYYYFYYYYYYYYLSS